MRLRIRKGFAELFINKLAAWSGETLGEGREREQVCCYLLAWARLARRPVA